MLGAVAPPARLPRVTKGVRTLNIGRLPLKDIRPQLKKLSSTLHPIVLEDSEHHYRHFLGAMDRVCEHCGAYFWLAEKTSTSSLSAPSYTGCCCDNKVVLPLLKDPPEPLNSLYNGSHKHSKHFRKYARPYNQAFQFASTGIKYSAPLEKGIQYLRLQGSVYHQIGSILPKEGEKPRFAQMYIMESSALVKPHAD